MATAEDLLALTAELVDISSVSLDEAALADHCQNWLGRLDHVTVDRHDDNVVARTDLGRDHRLVLAGHLDTVPHNDNFPSRRDGDVLWGCGTADMKGGLAVFMTVLAEVIDPAVDLTLVLYTAEEIEAEHSGLGHLIEAHPDWLAGDVAILGEPTGGAIEAGCQGSLRMSVRTTGERAHTARPWMGHNAVHDLGPILEAIRAAELRRPTVEGCEYREALEAVSVSGGVAGNVVPDAAELVVGHRYAPDRTGAEAADWVRGVIEGSGIEASVEVVEDAPAARPGLEHPLLRALIERSGLEVGAKLGWTDVARFSSIGVPGVNLGPGDSRLAHHPDERVTGAELMAAYQAVVDLARDGTDGLGSAP